MSARARRRHHICGVRVRPSHPQRNDFGKQTVSYGSNRKREPRSCKRNHDSEQRQAQRQQNNNKVWMQHPSTVYSRCINIARLQWLKWDLIIFICFSFFNDSSLKRCRLARVHTNRINAPFSKCMRVDFIVIFICTPKLKCKRHTKQHAQLHIRSYFLLRDFSFGQYFVLSNDKLRNDFLSGGSVGGGGVVKKRFASISSHEKKVRHDKSNK